MISIFLIGVPLALIALVVFITIGVIKGEQNKGGEEVIRTIYVYLVLFATLMMTIGGSVGMFMALADIVAPTPYYLSFDNYQTSFEKASPQENMQVPSEAELERRYAALVKQEKERQIARAKNSLIKSLGWIIIPLPVFLYYQRRLTKKV